MKELEEIKQLYSERYIASDVCYTEEDLDKMLIKAYNLAIDKCIENAEVIEYYPDYYKVNREELEKLKL